MAVVPFHELIGIEVLQAGGGKARVRAPDTPQLKNHFGAMHGGMLFTLGEITAAMAVTRTLGDKLADIRAITRGAQIRYLKQARGAITGAAQLDRDSDDALAALKTEESTTLPVSVSLEDSDGFVVATLEVEWFIGRKRK